MASRRASRIEPGPVGLVRLTDCCFKIEGHCDVLYSEDFQDGQKIESVTISNPFA